MDEETYIYISQVGRMEFVLAIFGDGWPGMEEAREAPRAPAFRRFRKGRLGTQGPFAPLVLGFRLPSCDPGLRCALP